MNNKKVPVETYSRVSGFYRPVQQWNKGKQSEYKERKVIDMEVVSNAIRNTK